eukprot:COSAG01_NODE_492_length_16335_cov_63.722284_17_plen_109_part_00
MIEELRGKPLPTVRSEFDGSTEMDRIMDEIDSALSHCVAWFGFVGCRFGVVWGCQLGVSGLSGSSGGVLTRGWLLRGPPPSSPWWWRRRRVEDGSGEVELQEFERWWR